MVCLMQARQDGLPRMLTYGLQRTGVLEASMRVVMLAE